MFKFLYKKWKYLLLILGLSIGVVMAATPEPNRLDKISAIQDTIRIGGINKTIAYTDENEDEGFIIKSDNKDYIGWGGGIGVYFSITNVSKTAQDAYVATLLGGGQTLNNVKRFAGNTIEYKIIPEKITATSTIKEHTIQKKVANWDLLEFDTKFKIEDSSLQRKDTKGRKVNGIFKDYFEAGETKYYRMSVQVPYGITENEFFIEVFGAEGAYGHLDPNLWTFEDKFNSDTKNTGDLNGQDGWSGNTGYDVINTDSPYEGDQHIIVVGQATRQYMTKDITDVESGTVYVSMRMTSGAFMRFILLNANNSQAEIEIGLSGDNNVMIRDNTGWANIGSYTDNVYFRVGIQFRGFGAAAYEGLSARTHKASLNDGGWQGPYGFYYENGIDIGSIEFDNQGHLGYDDSYFDYISPIYEEEVAVVEEIKKQDIIWF